MRRTLIGLAVGIVVGITLISMSGIGQAADGDAGSQNPLTSWMPDIKQIMNGAIRDIFTSAGTEIQDPELAGFYGKLTGNMMTSIVAGNAAGYTGPDIAYPVIRIMAPGYNSTVSGPVFVLVDTVDDFDPIGSLSVKILIDGTTTMAASYSLSSGYYEAMWDTATVSPGTMHTIQATATDSEGNSQAALSFVLVE